MSQFFPIKSRPRRRDKVVSTADAVKIVLTGKYATVAEAFASDKRALDLIASEHKDPIARNSGVMAGSLRHR